MKSSLRIICILCFAFGVLSTVPVFFESAPCFALIILAAVLACIPGSMIKNRWLRLLVSLLPFAALFAANTTAELVAGALACVAFTVFMTFAELDIPYYKCRKLFIGLLIALFTISILMDVVIIVTPEAQIYLNLRGVCIFLLGLLVSGIMMLRLVRAQEASAGLKWKVFNISSVVGIIASLMAISVVIYAAFAFLFSLIKPLETGPLPFFESHPVEYNSNNIAISSFGGPRHGSMNGYVTEEVEEDMLIRLEEEKRNRTLLIVICSVVAALAVAGAIIVFRKKKPQDVEDEKFDKEFEKSPDYTNRQKIRQFFKAYMYHIQGLYGEEKVFSKGSTSGDFTMNDPHPEAEELRQIYIRARYSADVEITDSDVENARGYLAVCLE